MNTTKVFESEYLSAPVGATFECEINDPANPGSLLWVKGAIVDTKEFPCEGGFIGRRMKAADGRDLGIRTSDQVRRAS